jgi:hypothetical protein
MANFKKVFNFREGVQVDDSTFVVNGSLVGIGTSVPTSFFDVRTTAQFTGLITANNMFVGGASTFSAGLQAGIVSVFSGIVTAATGVISYFGDGAGLFNIPTSQWVDVDTGIGVSSLYSGGNVGIGTLIPEYSLQVGANPENGFSGVGIREGNVYVSAAITATEFYGDGANLINLNASALASGIVTQARIPRLELDKIPLIPDFKLEPNLEITGVLTARGFFVGNLTGNLTGDVVSPGVSTFTNIEVSGNLVATASTARGLTGTPDIRVGVVSANAIDAGIALTVTRANITGDANVGILTVTGNSVKVGTGGSIFNITNGAIGIGTTRPSSTLVVYQKEGANLEILSETGATTLNLGGDLGIGASTIELRYENQRLELSNYAASDFVYHMSRDNASGDGNFRWVNGSGAVEIMTLTNAGKLGLGVTDPSADLQTTGSASFGGTLYVDGFTTINDDVRITGGLTYNTVSGISTAYDLDVTNNLDIGGNLSVSGSFDPPDNTNFYTIAGISTFNNLNVAGSLTLNNDFNYNTTSGITTVNNLIVRGSLTVINFDQAINSTTGISTVFDLEVTNDATIGNTLSVTNGLTVGGNIIASGSISFNNTSGVSTFNNVNIGNNLVVSGIATIPTLVITNPINFPVNQNFRTTSGVSTFNDLTVSGSLITLSPATITNISGSVSVEDDLNATTVVSTAVTTGGIIVTAGGRLGFGTDAARCVVDVGIRTDSFILPPVMTTAQRDALTPLPGAMIYNSSTNKHQGYNGTTWNDFY